MTNRLLSLLLSFVLLTIHGASAQESNDPSCAGLSIEGQSFGDVDNGDSCEDACEFFRGDGCVAAANGTGTSCGQWSYEWTTTNGAKASRCACGSNLDLLCGDEIATPSSVTLPPGDPKTCSDESVSSGEDCQVACNTLGFSSYEADTLNGLWECSCGDVGVFCKDSISSSDFTTEPKSCSVDGISSFAECSSVCGTDGSSWDTLTSSDGVKRSCCVCTSCGVYCTDSDATCVSSAGTCTTPLEGNEGTTDSDSGDGTAQSCAPQQISSFFQCSSSCDAMGSSGSAWSTSWASDTDDTTNCCICSSCGVYCTDNDPSCTSNLGACQSDDNGGGSGVVPATEPPTSAPMLPTSDSKTPTDDPKTPTDDPKTPTDDPRTPTSAPKTPTDDPKTPTDDPKIPTDDPKPPTTSAPALPTTSASVPPTTSAPVLPTNSTQTEEPVSDDFTSNGLADDPTSSGSTVVATGWCFLAVFVIQALT